MMTYLPIFSGNDARAFWDLAWLVERL